jgi:hypothetical protein
VLVVGTRIITRTYVVHNMGKDDWAMLAALVLSPFPLPLSRTNVSCQVFTVGYLATIFVARANGMGFSGKELSLDQMVVLIKDTLAIQIIYYLAVFCVKLSILLCYLRIGMLNHGWSARENADNEIYSGRSELRAHDQSNHLLPLPLLRNLHHHLLRSMQATAQDVGFYRQCTRNLYKHHRLILQ